MSWRARVRMAVLCVMLGVVFAAQAMAALIPFRQTWCDAYRCGCAATQDGKELLTWACVCDSAGSWRTCTYPT